MSVCVHTRCRCTENDNKTLFMEYLEFDDVWVVTCEEHVDEDNPHAELTDAIRNTPVDALTQLLVDE